MKRSRINHQVDVLCKMFVGWQLQEDMNDLAKFGSGTLQIDALFDTNTFNGNEIHQLNITEILNSWLLNDLSQNHIPKIELSAALVKIEMKVKAPEYGSRFTSFTFHCNSIIVTGNKTYNHSFEDVQDFECKKI